MPLRVDENYRGPRAFHVRSHRKLGKHRTIIQLALSVISWLVDHPEIAKVDFGRVVGSHQHARFTHRISITEKGLNLKVVLVAKNCAQVFTVSVRSSEAIAEVIQTLKERWVQLNAAND